MLLTVVANRYDLEGVVGVGARGTDGLGAEVRDLEQVVVVNRVHYRLIINF